MGRNTSIKTTTTDNFTQLVDNINNQSIDVGATGKLTTTVDSDIVGAINELDSNMGAKTSLTTTNKTSIVNAINELDSDLGQLSTIDNTIRDSNFAVSLNRMNLKFLAGTGDLSGLDSVGNDSDTLLGGFNDSSERFSISTALNTLSQDIQKLDSNVNREARMTTTATTVRGAINELDSDIGARPHTSLNTTAKNLVGAINENKASLNALAVFRNVATDSGSGSISVTVDSANDTLSILSGGSLKTTGFNNTIQIDHDVTGASSVNNSGNTFIQDLTIDAHGHVTGTASAAAPLPNNLVNSNISSSAEIDASKIADGTVSNTEFQYLNGVTSAVQTQLDSKLTPTGTFSGTITPNVHPYTFGVDGWFRSTDGYTRLKYDTNSHSHYASRDYHLFKNNSGYVVFQVDGSGNAQFAGNVTAYASLSDEKLKENIEVIPNALQKVKALKGVNFNYKKDGKRSTGLIAQDLQKVLPEAVYTTEDFETKEENLAINYGIVIGLLVEAIKELESEPIGESLEGLE